MAVVIAAQEDPGDPVQSWRLPLPLQMRLMFQYLSISVVLHRFLQSAYGCLQQPYQLSEVQCSPDTTSYAHEILQAPVLQHVIPNWVITSSLPTG